MTFYAPPSVRPHDDSASFPTRAIPGLTGVRGIAALYVFLTHYQLLLAVALQNPGIKNNPFMYNGFRGVDLFFVLSGFILMHVHSRDFKQLKRPALRVFYALRFLRVYPLNTIILVGLLPIALGMPDLVAWCRLNDGVDPQYHLHEFSAAGFLQSLFLAQTWTFIKLGEWNGPSWTLSAEVFGYAGFPFLAFVLNRSRSSVLCTVAACCLLLTLTVLLITFRHADNNPTGSFGLIRMIFGFSAGMCLCRTFHLWKPRRAMGSVITLGSVLFISMALSIREINVLAVWGFAGLILGLGYQQGPVSALMASRPVMFLGKISFSFYLIHYLPLKISIWLLETSDRELGLGVRIAALIAVPAICLIGAMLMYRYIELPIQHLARQLLRRSPGPHRTEILNTV
jgi:peptidoglycan/LPS O-acetylase OafA/YrhL